MASDEEKLQERLAVLADKGVRAQRHGRGDIDWDKGPALPIWAPKALCAGAISQFYFGELATAELCRRLKGRLGSDAADHCLDVQIADEERHARLYAGYLEGIGGIGTPDPAVSRGLAGVLAWTGAPQAQILAYHVILEGEALALQRNVGDWLPCPLFQKISKSIARDEARHVAFGKIYLRATLPRMPLGERLAIQAHLKSLWLDSTLEVLRRFAPIRLGARRFGRPWLDRRWAGWSQVMGSLGLFERAEAHLFVKR